MLSETKRDRAVVIGGSIAGLLSAKVLSAFFDEVVIVERDDIEEDAAPRKGVPQSPQPHILLAQGYRLLTAFFPDFAEALTGAGAVPIDWGKDFHYFVFGGWVATDAVGTSLKSFSCTRPLLETVIRQCVEGLGNVQRLSPYRVEALLGSAETVTGVQCRHVRDKGEVRSLLADLIVDTSGRSTNAPKWLDKLGAHRPTIETVDAGLGYASQRFKIPDGWQADWKVLLIAHRPPEQHRLGYLAQVENNELIATLGGYGWQYPPLDQRGFLQESQKLLAAEFYDAIAHATPASEIKAYRSTANKLRHYEKLEQMPDGFIALGDSVCALCPAYGQGLTTSALSATVLSSWLAENPNRSQPLSVGTFQKNLVKEVMPAWRVATQSDSGFENVKGEKINETLLDRFLNGYMQRLMQKSHRDGELALRLARITHMVDSPLNLFHQSLVMKSF